MSFRAKDKREGAKDIQRVHEGPREIRRQEEKIQRRPNA